MRFKTFWNYLLSKQPLIKVSYVKASGSTSLSIMALNFSKALSMSLMWMHVCMMHVQFTNPGFTLYFFISSSMDKALDYSLALDQIFTRIEKVTDEGKVLASTISRNRESTQLTYLRTLDARTIPSRIVSYKISSGLNFNLKVPNSCSAISIIWFLQKHLINILQVTISGSTL